MDQILETSKEILNRALTEYKPHVIIAMVSGGDDSLTMLRVAKELGITIDFVIHGNTRTGIEDTTLFTRKISEGYSYLEADAKDSYERYVMRKGFFGVGKSAHNFSYHILKQDHFETTVSRNIRQRKRNFRIMFLNGGRKDESENRKINFADPIKVTERKKNDIWVNLINDWSKQDCLNYLSGNGVQRNPVAVNLCRSGECMCGTMQTPGDRAEAKFFYPAWAKKLKELEDKAVALHGFGWGEPMPAKRKEIPGIEIFQPMCVGCTKNTL